ncbi:hypothetical protein LZ189_14065, partial [Rhodovulum sulfidophilum]|nr:hypothetical protein [Rhodovulum sulfidophilum]
RNPLRGRAASSDIRWISGLSRTPFTPFGNQKLAIGSWLSDEGRLQRIGGGRRPWLSELQSGTYPSST